MTAEAVQNGEVIILAPTGKDAALTAQVLGQARLNTRICSDFPEVERALIECADVLLVAEEALDRRKLQSLAALLARQPAWSDLPVLLVTRGRANSPLVDAALQELANVTLLERPIRPATLVSGVRSALKSRMRQYEVRDHLAERARNERALKEADERKDEFLATLAHELRNPLAPIRNSLSILRLSAGSDPVIRQLCDMLQRQTDILVRLVDDLLEVARITQGKIALRLESVDLAAVIQQAVEISRPFIDAQEHRLEISLPSEPLNVQGDAVRLAQVICNLLNNSAKYMNPGGQIWIAARKEHDTAVISVKDTGLGISADKLPRIFNMFTQIDRTTRQAQGGLGIGLSLVRALVEMHGGQVEAKSPGLDQGSEFLITLPLSETATKRAAPATCLEPNVLPHNRVLVVDDNRDAARSLSRLLALLGAQVQVANDGAKALELMESYRPAVVLLDIGMPNMDGYEVARRIRTRADFHDVKLIALTGWGQEQDRRRTAEAGFDHHLTKPADIREIESLLALGGR